MCVLVQEHSGKWDIIDPTTNRLLAAFSSLWQVFRYCHSHHYHIVY